MDMEQYFREIRGWHYITAQRNCFWLMEPQSTFLSDRTLVSRISDSVLYFSRKEDGFLGTAERKLEIVKYLCRERRTTMAELANVFGVSIRTIQRDIVFLSGEMRIPIFCQHGKYEGGVYIDDHYKWDKMYMTQEQLALLIKVGELVEGKLSKREIELYQQIISAYSLPTTKEFFNVDSSCPH